MIIEVREAVPMFSFCAVELVLCEGSKRPLELEVTSVFVSDVLVAGGKMVLVVEYDGYVEGVVESGRDMPSILAIQSPMAVYELHADVSVVETPKTFPT